MDTLTQWFGEGVCDARLERIRRFWDGDERMLVTVNSTTDPYRQIFEETRILELAPSNLRHQATLPGVNLPAFFADFGTVSTAKYWGGRTRFDSTGKNIFIEPVARSVQEALAVEPRAVDDPRMDAARALALFEALRRELNTSQLWFRTPDLQGPLNTAALVVEQQELMMAMHTDAEDVHRFLDRVTNLLIAYARHLRTASGDRVCGSIWPYTLFPADIGVSFTEDLMPLISAAAYREFGIPCLRRLSAELGALHIHCCGEWGRHAPALAQSGLPFAAFEFHYPFTRIDELEPLVNGRTVFVPYIALDKQTEFPSVTAYFEHLLKTTPAACRYWFAFSADSPEALAFAHRHGFGAT